MQLSDADIAKLGLLGRLDLSAEKRHAYAEQLSRIVAYVDKLREADVAATSTHLRQPVPPTKLRDDVPVVVQADTVLALAPRREGRFIVSPPFA